MPLVRDITLRNPIILQSAASFSLVSDLNPPLSGYDHYAVKGDMSRRGCASTASAASGQIANILLRRSLIPQTPLTLPMSDVFTFTSEFEPDVDGTFSNILTLKTIDDITWALGISSESTGKVVAYTAGTSLNPNYATNRSGDLPANTGLACLIRKADDTGYLYYPAVSFTGELILMRGTGSTTPFTNVCLEAITVGTPLAYEVSSDGQVQALFTDIGAFRSFDYGVHWDPFTAPLNNVREVVYSKKYNRWVICNDGTVPYFSLDLDPWVVPTLGLNDAFYAPAPITQIERLDAAGQYMLAISGFTPTCPQIITYLSSDGGYRWEEAQTLRVPNYGTTAVEALPVLVATPNRLFIYMASSGLTWNFDNSVFATPLLQMGKP